MSVSPGALIWAALLLRTDPQGLGGEILAAWLCHELAHVAVLWAVGGRVRRFRLTLAGAELRPERGRGLSYFGELLSVLAGPGCNLLLAGVLAGCGRDRYPAAGVQLCLGVFNLLPLPGLDGRRVLSLLRALWSDEIQKRKNK